MTALLDTVRAKGSSIGREHANARIAPEVTAALVLEHAGVQDAEIPALLEELRARAATVNRGDLSEVKAMLANQAVALAGIFSDLAAKGLQEVEWRDRDEAGDLRAMEGFLRLALKAQSQCRSTLETLAEIVSPRPVAYVRQANIASGHQQINNSPTCSPAREIKNENEPNKLLEKQHGERLDYRTQGAAGSLDPTMAALGTVDGAKD